MSIECNVDVDAKVNLSNPSFCARDSISERASGHADVVGIGVHGDKSAHQDVKL